MALLKEEEDEDASSDDSHDAADDEPSSAMPPVAAFGDDDKTRELGTLQQLLMTECGSPAVGTAAFASAPETPVVAADVAMELTGDYTSLLTTAAAPAPSSAAAAAVPVTAEPVHDADAPLSESQVLSPVAAEVTCTVTPASLTDDFSVDVSLDDVALGQREEDRLLSACGITPSRRQRRSEAEECGAASGGRCDSELRPHATLVRALTDTPNIEEFLTKATTPDTVGTGSVLNYSALSDTLSLLRHGSDAAPSSAARAHTPSSLSARPRASTAAPTPASTRRDAAIAPQPQVQPQPQEVPAPAAVGPSDATRRAMEALLRATDILADSPVADARTACIATPMRPDMASLVNVSEEKARLLRVSGVAGSARRTDRSNARAGSSAGRRSGVDRSAAPGSRASSGGVGVGASSSKKRKSDATSCTSLGGCTDADSFVEDRFDDTPVRPCKLLCSASRSRPLTVCRSGGPTPLRFDGAAPIAAIAAPTPVRMPDDEPMSAPASSQLAEPSEISMEALCEMLPVNAVLSTGPHTHGPAELAPASAVASRLVDALSTAPEVDSLQWACDELQRLVAVDDAQAVETVALSGAATLPCAQLHARLQALGVDVDGGVGEGVKTLRLRLLHDAHVEFMNWYLKLRTGFAEALDEHVHVLRTMVHEEAPDAADDAYMGGVQTLACLRAARQSVTAALQDTQARALALEQRRAERQTRLEAAATRDVAAHEAWLRERAVFVRSCGWEAAEPTSDASMTATLTHCDGSSAVVRVSVSAGGDAASCTLLELFREPEHGRTAAQRNFSERPSMKTLLHALVADAGIDGLFASAATLTDAREVGVRCNAVQLPPRTTHKPQATNHKPQLRRTHCLLAYAIACCAAAAGVLCRCHALGAHSAAV